MSEAMNGLYDKFDKTTNVNSYNIKLDFDNYGAVEEIKVPEEIKALVMGNTNQGQ